MQDSIPVLQGQTQNFSEANHTTGLIECNWAPSYTWTPPSGTVSGFFVAKLTALGSGKQSYIIFVVRHDTRPSDFLFQSAVTTYQAYNLFPHNLGDTDWRSGKSLYPPGFGPDVPDNPNAPSSIKDKVARAVSFNRPYFPDNNNIYYSAGQFFEWEYNMVRWMEKEGYDVTYQTDVDTHANAATLAPGKHKVLLSVGHDEYWSWQMRENVEQARNRTDQPLNIGFFGGNISYWQIRFANSGATTNPANAPNRTIVAYKYHIRDAGGYADPVLINDDPTDPNYNPTDNYLTTGSWQDNQLPSITNCPPDQPNCNCPPQLPNCTKQPEDELVGVRTDKDYPQGDGDFTFYATCPAWIKAGMANPYQSFTGLLGYEADRIFNDMYPNRTFNKVSESVFNIRDQYGNIIARKVSNAVYYRLNSGARVFAAGTVQW